MKAQRRQYAELKARRETEERNRALDVLSQNDVRYKKCTVEEIETATDHFSGPLKIGESGCGPVYGGNLITCQLPSKFLDPMLNKGGSSSDKRLRSLAALDNQRFSS
ncbi:Serine/threonine-protein kinase [Actinidia chinensis var. chinensis]|uniref:RING-type E3 ubiquitin transferase n=1 Tax=Actinidia chinensis var. chinensis TaxID=1590841 RepID=A0A2R6PMX8_ACTCC|nr:Serine/threonine-protein kinase [Actinidia chinensis var. chinensis]